jgi:hypothetical protein
MRTRHISIRVLTSSVVLALISTGLIVVSALAGDIQPPVPR